MKTVREKEFKAKMDRAFEDIENGRFDSVETIEELIDKIDQFTASAGGYK